MVPFFSRMSAESFGTFGTILSDTKALHVHEVERLIGSFAAVYSVTSRTPGGGNPIVSWAQVTGKDHTE